MLKKIKQINFSRRKRYVLLGLLCLVIFLCIYLYISKVNDNAVRLEQEKSLQLADDSSQNMSNDDYVGANEKLIEAYRLRKIDSEKASLAYDIGKNFQFSKDYSNAVEWLEIALAHYRAGNDKDNVEEVEAAIKRVEQYRASEQTTAEESPVDKSE